MRRIILDIDNTLTVPSDLPYEKKQPNWAVVEKVKEYKKSGFTIVLFTARNMNSYSCNIGLINKNTIPILIDWLSTFKIPYDELLVGKPWCGHDGFYVDDKAIRPSEFINLNYEEIQSLLND